VHCRISLSIIFGFPLPVSSERTIGSGFELEFSLEFIWNKKEGQRWDMPGSDGQENHRRLKCRQAFPCVHLAAQIAGENGAFQEERLYDLGEERMDESSKKLSFLIWIIRFLTGPALSEILRIHFCARILIIWKIGSTPNIVLDKM